MVGQGQFGKVYKANKISLKKNQKDRSYAVKMIANLKLKKNNKLKYLIQN